MTGPPDRLIDRPNQPKSGAMIDPLSEVLRSVRLIGGVFLDARFTAPWCVLSQITAEDCRPFLTTPAQIIAYHFIIEGRLLLELDGEPPLEINAGELVLLPRNDAHTLSSALGLKPVSADDLIQPAADGGLAQISYGGGGELTYLVCGFLASEEVHNPLIATLPRVLKLDIRQGGSRDWIEASVRFAARELTEGRFASSSVMSRLSELLFVEAVRNYASTLKEDETGWLKGLRDPYVGRALALLHGRIDAPWTAEMLARDVALSRSAFNDRFTSLVGIPAIRYLTLWRLQVAKEKLRQGRGTIAQIAHAVGYESEVAFNRAFKREFGHPPARWRQMQGTVERSDASRRATFDPGSP
jgi:AraC-like DNA-binding protein